jgi:hypothetical protein
MYQTESETSGCENGKTLGSGLRYGGEEILNLRKFE